MYVAVRAWSCVNPPASVRYRGSSGYLYAHDSPADLRFLRLDPRDLDAAETFRSSGRHSGSEIRRDGHRHYRAADHRSFTWHSRIFTVVHKYVVPIRRARRGHDYHSRVASNRMHIRHAFATRTKSRPPQRVRSWIESCAMTWTLVCPRWRDSRRGSPTGGSGPAPSRPPSLRP